MTRNTKTPDEPEHDERRSDGSKSARPLSADLQAHIGVRLKAYYDSVLSEPIPTRFAELLDRLDAGERRPVEDGGAASASAAETRADPSSEPTPEGGAGTDVAS